MNDESRRVPKEIRDQVRKRDKDRCRKCGRKKGLEFHHIIAFLEIGRNSKWADQAHQKNNLILLCSNCHSNAPDDPFEFFKWIQKIPLLPPDFSKSIELMQMGLPMLILKRKDLYNLNYNLSVETDDWKILVEDMELFLRDLWDVQLNIGEDDSWDRFGFFIHKYSPSSKNLRPKDKQKQFDNKGETKSKV